MPCLEFFFLSSINEQSNKFLIEFLMYAFVLLADSEQGISDWSTEYNSHGNCSDVNSSQVCHLL